MKDFNRLVIRFRQFGGIRLVWQYAKMGVLWPGIKECIRCALTRQSFKKVYVKIQKRVEQILIDEEKLVRHKQCTTNTEQVEYAHSSTIWFCWLQGMDKAPELVHTCYHSLLKHLPENEIVIIDGNNYSNYVSLPDNIIRKYNEGIIPHPLFSDILRLELLLKHGGTWIDSTVLCTSNLYWDVIQKSDLFLFRYFNHGKITGISNWFIRAKAGNAILQEILESLYNYWEHYDCVVDYYMFHLYYALAARRHHEEIQRMPRGNSFANIQLGDRLSCNFNRQWWEDICSKVSFHKLNYRLAEKAKANKDSYYNHIINIVGKSEHIL